MRKVAALLDEIRRGGENPEIVREVIALAKQYRIATPYTSFLVLESEGAYDRQGLDRRGNSYKAPTPTVQAPGRSFPKDDAAARPTKEPTILAPKAKESDHNESADNEDHRQPKGGSKDPLSYLKGESSGVRGRPTGQPGVYDAMGTGLGSGGGGRYGGRFGGRENLVARGGGTRATESAVLAALKWLARHQNPDGSWSAAGFHAQCSGGKCNGEGASEHDIGVTGLSLLAFLGAGYTHLSRDEYADPQNPGRILKFGEVVKKGLQYLLAHQDAEGAVVERGSKFMYGHAIAANALSEAFGMTMSQPLKEPAQAAINFLVASQNPGKAWRYSPKCGDNDSSVTGWAVLALKSAELSELNFPWSAYEGAIAWFDAVTDEQGRTGYNALGTGKVFIPGACESWDHHENLAGVSMLGRILIQKKRSDPRLGAAVKLLAADLPEARGAKIDYNYWFFGSIAMFQFDGSDGPMWKQWNPAMVNALVPAQKTGKEGCANGSWDASSRWGDQGGRVWATAINAMTLEVYYRYPSVFGGRSK